MSAALALLASLMWGCSDFLGGTASRRAPVGSVLGVSQLSALLGLVPIVVLAGELDAERAYVAPAVAAGLLGVTALAGFYRALSVGTMGVVAPIAALGVVVPVAVALAGGEAPSGLQVAGIAVAVLGVVLASGPELRGGAGLEPVLLAGLAGLGFGGVFVFLEIGARSSTGMTLLTMRLTSVTVLTCLLLALLPRRGADLRMTRTALPLAALIGATDVLANGAYAIATQRAGALVSVTAVLASLYPVVTVLLARRFHAERLRPAQLVGVTGALTGVVLLAAG